MDKPISVGDLVMTIGTNNPVHEKYLGCPGKVIAPCPCGCDHWTLDFTGDLRWWKNHLKRIPPLSELEGEKRDEKLTEPA